MRNSDTRRIFIAAIAVLAVLVPFLNKAFHIDDPLFLWMGQRITTHPGDPYGFAINWYITSQPMFSIMQNPPLSSFYMALIANFLGWSEPAMHGAFLVPAVAAVLGTFFLARRLSGSPLLAALLLLFTPVFLVSATGVMCDVWLLAFWVWSIECWKRALERTSAWFLFLASVLVAAAALTKYFGVALVPLLAVYTLARERRVTHRILYLLIPILVIASYEAITKAKYGQGLFSSAMLVSWNENAKPDQHFVHRLLIGLSFTGGCLLSLLFYAPLLKLSSREPESLTAESGWKPSFRILIIGFALLVIFVPLFHFGADLPLSSTIEGALFVTIGIGILVLTLADVLQYKTADSLLLFLWMFGTFIFAAMMNWTISARTFLPMAPAVIILLIRRLRVSALVAAAVTGASFEKDSTPKLFEVASWWPLLPAALVSLLIAIGDYTLANTARTAASRFQQRFRNESGTVWFEGHWGFQYYMQHWRAKPLDLEQHGLVPGDVLIVPVNNTNVSRQPAAPTIASFEETIYAQFFAITMSREVGAGFYSSKWGPLPWEVAAVPPERYLTFRIK
jgi:4-amino-4-deoxy-L-arabinose transferase-like glycosyltransferase